MNPPQIKSAALLDAPDALNLTLPVQLWTKTLDATQGVTEQLVSVSGNRDKGGDVALAGAVAFGLTLLTPKGVWSHDWKRPVGRTLDAVEILPGDKSLPGDLLAAGFGATKVRAQFNLDTVDGREAFAAVKFYGEEQQWSIGYDAVDPFHAGKAHNADQWEQLKALGVVPDATIAAVEEATGPTRFLPKVLVYEWSPVLFGMNPLTRTQSVKSLDAAGLDAFAEQVEARERIVLAKIAELEPQAAKLWVDDSALEGSFEALRAAVAGVVRTWTDETFPPVTEEGSDYVRRAWSRVVATYPDRVLVLVDNVPGGEGEDRETAWSIPYTSDAGSGELVVTLGTAERVEISLAIEPAAGDPAEDDAEPPEDGTPTTAGVDPSEVEAKLVDLEVDVAHLAGAAKAGRIQAERNRQRLQAIADAVGAMLDETTPQAETENGAPEGEAKAHVPVDARALAELRDAKAFLGS